MVATPLACQAEISGQELLSIPEFYAYKLTSQEVIQHLDMLEERKKNILEIRDNTLRDNFGVENYRHDSQGRISFIFPNDVAPDDRFMPSEENEYYPQEDGRVLFVFDGDHPMSDSYVSMFNAIWSATNQQCEEIEMREKGLLGLDPERFQYLDANLLKRDGDWFFLIENPENMAYIEDPLTGMFVFSPTRFNYMMNEMQTVLLGIDPGFTKVDLNEFLTADDAEMQRVEQETVLSDFEHFAKLRRERQQGSTVTMKP